MNLEVNFEGIKYIFEKCGYSNEAKIFNEFQNLYSNNSKKINKLYSFYGVSSIETILEGLLESRSINEKTVNGLGMIAEALQGELVENFWIGNSNYDSKVLDVLDYFGIVFFDRDRDRFTFFIHPRFSITMFRYLISMDDKSAMKHMEQIYKIKKKKDPNKEDRKTLKALYDNSVKDFKERISNCLKEFIIKEYSKIFLPGTKPEHIWVDFLPTSTDFYEAGINFYKSRVGIWKQHDIFSTTSGIILPEEHYGSEFFIEKINRPDLAKKISKNKFRKMYFNTLMKCSKFKPRLYHFELERSKNQFEDIVSQLNGSEKTIYISEANKIFNKFLEMECFGLVKVKKFYQGEDKLKGIFNYLTLGNGVSVLISGRVVDKISHGFWIRPVKTSFIKEALREIKLDNMIKKITNLAFSYISGKWVQEHYFREQFWVAFAGPLIFILFKLSEEKVNTIKEKFLQLSNLLENDFPGKPEFIKKPGKSSPEEKLTDINDLFK